MKRCSDCKETKSEDEFYNDKSRKDKLTHICKPCKKKRDLEYQNKNRYKLNIKRYGITQEEYDQMYEKQNGTCAICHKPETAKGRSGQIRRLAIDHSHKTGKVRGLLCFNCNKKLSTLENQEFFENALAYLNSEI